MTTEPSKKIALTLSGGGARGAYEAGVIHYLRTMLPTNKLRQKAFDIYTGTSVGALNASLMASLAHDPESQGKTIFQLWSQIKEENVYRRDSKALLSFLKDSTKGILMGLIMGPVKRTPRFHSLLDTTPFVPFVEKAIDWKKIKQNIQEGHTKALALATTNIYTGLTELFISKHPTIEYTGAYVNHMTSIQPIHALASASIPIIFPAAMINGIAYTDGGLRLNTPMSPAIQLGADSIMIVSPHYKRHLNEKVPFHGHRGQLPTMGQILGRVMNSIFLDRLRYDIEQLDRINRIIDWAEMKDGKDFLPNINSMLKQKDIKGDIANRGLKRIQVLNIDPSEDIGLLFQECFNKDGKQHFTSFERFLVRFLDVDPQSGFDFLSYITFMPAYISKLLELGFEDAKQHHDKIQEFFE